MRLFGRFRSDPEPEFSGSCLVLQHTMDGIYVGRCYHSTYGGICHLHGHVQASLDGDYADWPKDYELEER